MSLRTTMRPILLVAPTTSTVVSWASGTVNSHMGPRMSVGSSRVSSTITVVEIWPSPENLRHTSSNICRDFLPSPTGFTSSRLIATFSIIGDDAATPDGFGASSSVVSFSLTAVVADVCCYFFCVCFLLALPFVAAFWRPSLPSSLRVVPPLTKTEEDCPRLPLDNLGVTAPVKMGRPMNEEDCPRLPLDNRCQLACPLGEDKAVAAAAATPPHWRAAIVSLLGGLRGPTNSN